MHIVKQFKTFGMISIITIAVSGCVTGPMVAASAAGVGGANVAGSSITVPQQYDDLTIKADIYTILNNMKGLNGANIEVTVFNSIVLLLGQIPTQNLKDELTSKTSKIEGVKIVYDQIAVGQNVNFTTYADDSWITSKVIGNMVGHVNPLHFKVVTQEGVVYLLGQVTREEASEAATIAQHTSGVKQVIKIFNYIAPTQAKPAAASGSQSGVVQDNASKPTPTAARSAPAPAPAHSAHTASPAVNPSHIPQTAPDYMVPSNEKVGPAASD